MKKWIRPLILFFGLSGSYAILIVTSSGRSAEASDGSPSRSSSRADAGVSAQVTAKARRRGATDKTALSSGETSSIPKVAMRSPFRHGPLLGANCTLTDYAAEALDWDARTRERVQERFDQFGLAQSEAFEQRAVFLAALSDLENGVLVYDVPAEKDRGEKAKETLKEDLKLILGESSSQLVVGGLYEPWYGSFGALDVSVRFFTAPQGDNPEGDVEWRASWACVDPESGRRVCSDSDISLERFQYYFGSTLIDNISEVLGEYQNGR